MAAIHIAMIIITIMFVVLAAELRDMMKAILAFMCANIAMAAIFYLLGAPYLSVFQLLTIRRRGHDTPLSDDTCRGGER